jgi:hypothetical protein
MQAMGPPGFLILLLFFSMNNSVIGVNVPTAWMCYIESSVTRLVISILVIKVIVVVS